MPSVILKEIEGLVEGKLIRRLNRFVVEVNVDDRFVKAHLKDSGRLTELMKEDNKVLIRPKKREKTDFEVFVIYDGQTPVVVNSSIHSELGSKVLKLNGYRTLKREVKVGNSRIDLLVEKEGQKKYVEIKGCTLIKERTALFPDAPTERGVKHVRKITELGGIVLFLVMREDADKMMPNISTHPEFVIALREAVKKEITVIAALLKPDIHNGRLSIKFKGYIPVIIPGIGDRNVHKQDKSAGDEAP